MGSVFSLGDLLDQLSVSTVGTQHRVMTRYGATRELRERGLGDGTPNNHRSRICKKTQNVIFRIVSDPFGLKHEHPGIFRHSPPPSHLAKAALRTPAGGHKIHEAASPQSSPQ